MWPFFLFRFCCCYLTSVFLSLHCYKAEQPFVSCSNAVLIRVVYQWYWTQKSSCPTGVCSDSLMHYWWKRDSQQWQIKMSAKAKVSLSSPHCVLKVRWQAIGWTIRDKMLTPYSHTHWRTHTHQQGHLWQGKLPVERKWVGQEDKKSD